MSGRRIVFCTFGSLGDIHPYLALAREMKRRGHAPIIATVPVYRALIEAQGVAFRPIRPDIDVTDPEVLRRVMDRRTGARTIICDMMLPALRDTYEDTAAAAADADLLVTHPIAWGALLFARVTGMPWASTALAPVSVYSAFDASVIPIIPFAELVARLSPFFQRPLLNAFAALFERLLGPFRELEKELGLPPASNPLLWGHSPHLVLALFSRWLAAPQADWPPNAYATGFPFYAHSAGDLPELQRFVDAGEAPIVFTLGSAAVGAAGDFFEQSVGAARQLGRRAVLLIGRDERNRPKGELASDVIAVPYAPHAAVFPRACVVVHQGGIGTTGEAMRAGRPMLVVPFSHDQPDHASRLVRLGVGRSISRERYSARNAAREIEILLHRSTYAQRAAQIGHAIGAEDGTTRACDLLSKMFERR